MIEGVRRRRWASRGHRRRHVCRLRAVRVQGPADPSRNVGRTLLAISVTQWRRICNAKSGWRKQTEGYKRRAGVFPR